MLWSEVSLVFHGVWGTVLCWHICSSISLQNPPLTTRRKQELCFWFHPICWKLCGYGRCSPWLGKCLCAGTVLPPPLCIFTPAAVLGGWEFFTGSKSGLLVGTAAAQWVPLPTETPFPYGLRAAAISSYSCTKECSHFWGSSSTVAAPAGEESVRTCALGCLGRLGECSSVSTISQGSSSCTFKCIAAWVAQTSCWAVLVSSIGQWMFI